MPDRCAWCGTDPLYTAYHDLEWGVPNHDDRHLFEMLVLEGAQAGLSWITILKKRENYRRAFDDFDADKVARYTAADVERLMADAGIVRNRLKIESAIANARATLSVRERFGSLDALLWKFVDGVPRDGARRTLADVPASGPIDAVSTAAPSSRRDSASGPGGARNHTRCPGIPTRATSNTCLATPPSSPTVTTQSTSGSIGP